MVRSSVGSLDPFQTTCEVRGLQTDNSSMRKPQAVVLHYTAGNDARSEEWLTTGPVSTHYLVKSNAQMTQIVPEGARAWHAGKAFWRGFEDVNSVSLGVEVTGWGHEGDHVPEEIDRGSCMTISGMSYSWFPFPEEQFQAVAKLLVDFRDRWHIKPEFFIGHSDISPGRKIDPGPLFPWERLHKEFGIGAWPDFDKGLCHIEMPPVGQELYWTQLRLRDYGYNCPLTNELDPETLAVIQAFQMHFRPNLLDGQPDFETRFILGHLVDQYHYDMCKNR